MAKVENIFGPYFSLSEFVKPGVEAPADVIENLLKLVKFGLNPVRKKFGATTITSGYRDSEHNKRVGGVKDSQHITGEAVDFIVAGADMREIFEWLKTWWPGQVIFYTKRGHIHLGLPNVERAEKGILYGWKKDS